MEGELISTQSGHLMDLPPLHIKNNVAGEPPEGDDDSGDDASAGCADGDDDDDDDGGGVSTFSNLTITIVFPANFIESMQCCGR